MTFRDWFNETAKAPDYSFDRFVKSAEELKKTKDSLVGSAKEKEAEMDKEAEKKKKEVDQAEKDQEKDPKDNKEEPPVKFDDQQNKLLGQLRKIAKERTEKDSKEKDKK